MPTYQYVSEDDFTLEFLVEETDSGVQVFITGEGSGDDPFRIRSHDFDRFVSEVLRVKRDLDRRREGRRGQRAEFRVLESVSLEVIKRNVGDFVLLRANRKTYLNLCAQKVIEPIDSQCWLRHLQPSGRR